MSNTSPPFDPRSVLAFDSWLEPFLPAIDHRYKVYQKWKDSIFTHEGGYDAFSKSYERFGLNVDDKGQITYREWAPNAVEAVLIGDFSAYC